MFFSISLFPWQSPTWADWTIYLEEMASNRSDISADFYGKLVGRYTVRPMDPLGTFQTFQGRCSTSEVIVVIQSLCWNKCNICNMSCICFLWGGFQISKKWWFQNISYTDTHTWGKVSGFSRLALGATQCGICHLPWEAQRGFEVLWCEVVSYTQRFPAGYGFVLFFASWHYSEDLKDLQSLERKLCLFWRYLKRLLKRLFVEPMDDWKCFLRHPNSLVQNKLPRFWSIYIIAANLRRACQYQKNCRNTEKSWLELFFRGCLLMTLELEHIWLRCPCLFVGCSFWMILLRMKCLWAIFTRSWCLISS